jgi:hypothetical protein
MRRLIASLAIVFIGLWAAGAPSWADTTDEEWNYTVSGPFSGTTQTPGGNAICSPPAEFTTEVFDLTVRPAPDNPHQPRMLGTLHIEVCVRYIEGAVYGLRGTFVFTSSRGATLNGTATGTMDIHAPWRFSSRLDVTSGTSSFKNVSGHIDVSGTTPACCEQPWTVTGTSTGHLHGPK